jgi:hypothetical protein
MEGADGFRSGSSLPADFSRKDIQGPLLPESYGHGVNMRLRRCRSN